MTWRTNAGWSSFYWLVTLLVFTALAKWFGFKTRCCCEESFRTGNQRIYIAIELQRLRALITQERVSRWFSPIHQIAEVKVAFGSCSRSHPKACNAIRICLEASASDCWDPPLGVTPGFGCVTFHRLYSLSRQWAIRSPVCCPRYGWKVRLKGLRRFVCFVTNTGRALQDVIRRRLDRERSLRTSQGEGLTSCQHSSALTTKGEGDAVAVSRAVMTRADRKAEMGGADVKNSREKGTRRAAEE